VYEKSINEAELVLGTQKDSLAPVHKVWEEVVRRSKEQKFEVASLPDFSAMLEGDHRFHIIPAQMKSQDDPERSVDGELDENEMERLGFFSEDQVKLRSARVVERVVQEDEEEIGSIRRRAFVSKPVKKNASDEKNTGSIAARKKSPLPKKKKIAHKKSKPVQKKKTVRSRKPKQRKRGKK
jgi:hypothetical protein